jgi:hypothetical protein
VRERERERERERVMLLSCEGFLGYSSVGCQKEVEKRERDKKF